jgi:hypothetical protein
MKQGWVPRVVNATLGLILLAFLVPLFTHLGGLALGPQVLLVFLAVPTTLLAAGCLISVAAPGWFGRMKNRSR